MGIEFLVCGDIIKQRGYFGKEGAADNDLVPADYRGRRDFCAVIGVPCGGDDGFFPDPVVFHRQVLVLELMPPGRVFRYCVIKGKRPEAGAENFPKTMVPLVGICGTYDFFERADH